MAMLMRRLLTSSLVALLTFISTITYLSPLADPFSTWLVWKSSSNSMNIIMITAPPMAVAAPSLIGSSYIFYHRTRVSHNQHHGHHHRHYRDRCHHPFLYNMHSHLLLLYASLLVLIAGVMNNSLPDDNLLSMSNLLNNQSNPISSMNTNHLSNDTNPYVFKEHVCGSIDIRNSVAQFKKLENCTIVEGHLKIVLIDNGKAKDFENLTFPKLREITDYFLMFRVMGLQSLTKMFPNLSVIRGRALLHNYAFVIYEMLHLQEIGLKSLTNIVRGDIRIQKNPNLCFVDTIDWSRIARNFLISDNKDQNVCPNCAENCPIVSARRNDGKSIGDSYNRVCWTSNICQKHSCSPECESLNRTCSQMGECCPEQCLGGCATDPLNPSSRICFSCKNFVYKNRCYDVCPNDSYAYYNRRCLSENECHQLSTTNVNQKYKFKAFMKECDYKCPVGYTEDPDDSRNCIKCGDNCPKICESTQISNIAQAQSLRGCTIINGSLEIYINNQGAEMVKELEENLKDLVEIMGFLKIARSFPLITLNFLRNLKIIRGNILERNSYSLLIFDNPNLQDLWTFQENEYLINNEKRIKILNGGIFVHINPKLCYDKIKNMIEYVDIPDLKLPWDERNVSTHSNGDKVPCNVFNLYVYVNKSEITSEMLLLEFENFKIKMEDPRSLLGYLIYYRETEHQNLTIFDGLDACSNNEWTVIEYDTMRDDDNSTKFYYHIIQNLKPYTQYALYIKTYTINLATKGAQSDIIYFKTLPDTPSQPLNLFAKAKKHDEIFVKWDPPSKPNGEVTHYNVQATRDELRIIHRDYCTESITKDHTIKPLVIKKEPIISNHWLHLQNLTELSTNSSNGNNQAKLDPSKQCCSCRNDDVVKIRPNDVEQSINFEDYLLNTVYVKRTVINVNSSEDDSSRRKRHINFDNSTMLNVLFHEQETYLTAHIPEMIETKVAAVEKWEFNKSVEDGLYIQINDLYHYTEYTIEVKACQNESNLCSITAITSVKTLPLAGADDIDEQSIVYTFDNSTNNLNTRFVHIKWKEPLYPNGFILSYQIEYKRVTKDPPNSILAPICITRDHYEKNDNGYIVELAPGNYSVRLRARSLANYGNWTRQFHIFIDKPANSNITIVIITIVLFIILVIIPLVLYYKIRINQNKFEYISVNPDYISSGLFYRPDPKWEIPREKIVLIRELGEGSFGKVFEGEYTKDNLTSRCAVKTLNENVNDRDRINFLKEADVMKSFTDCNHVVKLLGICIKDQPFLVLMEIMNKGDLRNYLRNNRPDNKDNPENLPPSLNQIYKMAVEIADGMAYLASKKFVHRDLAARNCMLSNDLTVKIGDFGMTRDICECDYYRKGDKGFLPVRWMSPESLKDGIFTTYSDVWAYGVVLWEMVTLASQPYQGLSNEEVLKFVIDGNHMAKPEDCPDVLWQLMLLCWRKKAKARPTFIKMIQMLLTYVTEEDKNAFLAVSFFNVSKISDEDRTIQANHAKDKSSAHLNDSSKENSIEYNSDSSGNGADDQLAKEDMNVRFFPLTGIPLYDGNAVIPDKPVDTNKQNISIVNETLSNNNIKNSSSPVYQMETLMNSDVDKKKSTKHFPRGFYHSKNSNETKNKNDHLNSSRQTQNINGHLIDTSMV